MSLKVAAKVIAGCSVAIENTQGEMSDPLETNK